MQGVGSSGEHRSCHRGVISGKGWRPQGVRGKELWGQGHPQGGGRSRSRCQGPRVGSVQRAQCCWLGSAGAFQRERGFLTPVTFTSWAAALEPGVCVCLFFYCVLAVVSSSPPRSMSVACLL